MITGPMMTGQCLCGAIRYEADGIGQTGYCHCGACRRWSGAPAMAWGEVPLASLRILSGMPRSYPSSAQGWREFCGDCGSLLWFRDADSYSLHLAALDNANGAPPPQFHIHYASKLTWFDTMDTLPRHGVGTGSALVD